ncbi:MAG: polysaccharide pyruvyl transferase family protein [Eubacterium sp.]
MKIGIITINIHTKVLNFASPVHTVAFQHFLEKHGIETTIIDYKPRYYGKFDIRHPLFYYIDHPEKNLVKQQLKAKEWKDLFYLQEKRYDRFMDFQKKYYTKITDKCYTWKMLNEEDPGFDCYICATDIIWKRNKVTGFEPGYFLALNAMKGKKKIAYSPSRGAIDYTIQQEKEFLKLISDFDFLSARERSFKDYINNISGLNIPQVLDPVFLNDVSYYRENMMIPPEHLPKKKFILIYIVMEDPEELVREACTFAAKHDLEVIELGQKLYHADIPEGMHHDVVYDIGIEEWLWYMDHAEYIFTNSFHACCFSILMHKQFFAGDRAGDKIDSVLEMFNLSWRRLPNAELDGDLDRVMKKDPIDFKPVEEILQRQRKVSEDYILGAIHELEHRDHQPILPNVDEIIDKYPQTPEDPPETQIYLGHQQEFEENKVAKIKAQEEKEARDRRFLIRCRHFLGRRKRALKRWLIVKLGGYTQQLKPYELDQLKQEQKENLKVLEEQQRKLLEQQNQKK